MAIDQPGGKASGFASMTKERHREVARLGCLAMRAQGKAHVWTSEEARAAHAKRKKKKQEALQDSAQ